MENLCWSNMGGVAKTINIVDAFRLGKVYSWRLIKVDIRKKACYRYCFYF